MSLLHQQDIVNHFQNNINKPQTKYSSEKKLIDFLDKGFTSSVH